MSNIIAKHPGMYGQDGRGVITEATFGCVNYAANASRQRIGGKGEANE